MGQEDPVIEAANDAICKLTRTAELHFAKFLGEKTQRKYLLKLKITALRKNYPFERSARHLQKDFHVMLIARQKQKNKII